MWRLFLAPLVICLAIAALVQIAIVASCARRAEPSVREFLFPPWDDHVLSLCQRFVPPDAIDQTAPVIGYRAFGRDWIHIPRRSTNDSPFDRITVHRIGWPCRVVAGQYWHDHGLGHLGDELVDLRPIHRGVSRPDYLPTSPLWAGLAVNLLAFAAGAWIVMFAALRARAFSRRLRGRCTCCGYPITGDRCPECGERSVPFETTT